MKNFAPDQLVLVRMWNPPMWRLSRYSHCIEVLHCGYAHMTQDSCKWKDEDIIPAEGNMHLLGTGNEYVESDHVVFEVDGNFQNAEKAEFEKKIRQLEAERDLLAEWAANYGDCPMPEGHACEHQKIPGICRSKNVQPECWVKAAHMEISQRANKKDKENTK